MVYGYNLQKLYRMGIGFSVAPTVVKSWLLVNEKKGNGQGVKSLISRYLKRVQNQAVEVSDFVRNERSNHSKPCKAVCSRCAVGSTLNRSASLC